MQSYSIFLIIDRVSRICYSLKISRHETHCCAAMAVSWFIYRLSCDSMSFSISWSGLERKCCNASIDRVRSWFWRIIEYNSWYIFHVLVLIFFHKVPHKEGNFKLKHAISEQINFSKVKSYLRFSIIYQKNITMRKFSNIWSQIIWLAIYQTNINLKNQNY